jgi:hypothetical protein
MFCPECRAEYRTGFTRCHDCNVELVDHLPAQKAGDPTVRRVYEFDETRYVTIATVQGPFEEAQICSFLESNGIPTRIRAEALRHTHGIVIDGIGAVRIQVPQESAAFARDLLNRADHGDFRIDDSRAY